MTPQEKGYILIRFQNRVLRANGSLFEALFTQVMDAAWSDFIQIKPQGAIGDRKNDGYHPPTGRYYQVYAPENPKASAATAVKKAKGDFQGLKDYWDEQCPVRSYKFVFNDKFSGSYPEVESTLAEIKAEHDLEDASVYYAKHLLDELMGLPDEKIFSIFGYPPAPDQIENISHEVLRQVIEDIMSRDAAIDASRIMAAPDFDYKLKHNEISVAADLLKTASYQVFEIDNYFERSSNFEKQELRDALNRLYQSTVTSLVSAGAGEPVTGDQVVFAMLEDVGAATSNRVQSAALVVMAFFFESCDIFEDPGSTRMQGGADASS